jgi:hypothetical protein
MNVVSPKISGRQPRRLPDPVGAYGGLVAASQNNNLYHPPRVGVNEAEKSGINPEIAFLVIIQVLRAVFGGGRREEV